MDPRPIVQHVGPDGGRFSNTQVAEGLARKTAGVNTAPPRLATYGTLRPGRPNHHQLDGLDGRWFSGSVNGVLFEAGWGATLGHPALILDPEGPAVDVDFLESVDLPAHWARLVAFEGPGYQRVITRVHIPSGEVEASIYVLAPPHSLPRQAPQ